MAADIPKVKRKRRFKRHHRIEKILDHEPNKVVAVALDLTLGIFAVHRLYLGTHPKVPVVYALTLGGGGFMVLIDMGVIIFTKNLDQYKDNDQVLMWNTED